MITDVRRERTYFGRTASPFRFAIRRSVNVFRVRSTKPICVRYTILTNCPISGPVVQEIHQECNEWVSQVVRKYAGEDHIEFEWLVGPIPDEYWHNLTVFFFFFSRDRFDNGLFFFIFPPTSSIGREVISRFHIPFYRNNQTFYTDSNGREMLKRVLNYRPSFALKENSENVSGNYYPITSRITLSDNGTRFSVLNDRSQGGTSLQNGQIELMVHLSEKSIALYDGTNTREQDRGSIQNCRENIIKQLYDQ